MDEISKSQPVVAAGEKRRRLGRLKVFLGIGPGVGKTAAMMRAAMAEKAAGRNVVVLAIDAPEELETDLATGHPSGTESGSASSESSIQKELEIDAILIRQPDLAIVDELASPNPSGARHGRRFREALTLLEAGIDVYGTLNVYELASRAEALWDVTRIASSEAVPDSVLDNAEIAFVDVAPSELLHRLKHAQFRLPEALAPGKSRFFEERNLLELREMAARLLAERAARDAQQFRPAGGPAKSSHRLLVAIEFGWEAEHLILLTRRLAGSLNAPWVLLSVENGTKRSDPSEEKSPRMLQLARELGAEVITMVDDDFVDAVLRVALSRNITQIITGKTAKRWWQRPFSPEPAFAELARRSGGIDIHVAEMPGPPTEGLGPVLGVAKGRQWQWFVAVMATAVVMGGGFLIQPLITAAAASLLSLLTIVAVAAFLDRGPALLATSLIAAGWDYFFLPPYFHFSIARPEDKVLMAMYFTVALILAQYTTRMRSAEAAERQREARATALYLLMRELADAATTEGIVEKLVAEMKRSFGAAAAVLLADDSNRLHLQPTNTLTPGETDLAAAAWVFERRQWAGKFTGNLPMLDTMFLPLESGCRIVGVMGFRIEGAAAPTIHERNLLEAFARQAAVALDRQHLRELSDKAEVAAASERLGKTLLDSMSHEIRTPLTVIQAATNDLEDFGQVSETGRTALNEIQEATRRLDRLVGQVLDITRLESGHFRPLISECEVRDIVNVAISETRKQLSQHELKVDVERSLPLVRTDFVLLQQALMNLLANASVHTEPGTSIELRVWREGPSVFLAVADRGPGIDSQLLPRVFEKFYRGPSAPTGGVGLGLSLVKGFVKAIGGNVTAANRTGGGVDFTIVLPLSGPKDRKPVAI
jgi:two-component system sensor histidine kinase KdpD